MHATTVADVMTRDVVTVEPTMPVKDVTEMLVRQRISAVAVVDTCRNVLGVVTEMDLLCRKEHEDDQAPPRPSMFTPRRLRKRWRKASGVIVQRVGGPHWARSPWESSSGSTAGV